MPSINDVYRQASSAGAGTTLPPLDWVPITPHATDNLPTALRALRANVAGVVYAKTALSGTSYRTLNFAAGETRFGYFIAVRNDSTATGLEGGV